MTRCAAAAEPRPEAHQQSGNSNQHPTRRHLRGQQAKSGGAADQWRGNEAGNKSYPPALVAPDAIEASSQDAADSCDAAKEQHQQRRSESDQRPAEQSQSRIELGHPPFSKGLQVDYAKGLVRELSLQFA